MKNILAGISVSLFIVSVLLASKGWLSHDTIYWFASFSVWAGAIVCFMVANKLK